MKKISIIILTVIISNFCYSQTVSLFAPKKETVPYHAINFNRAYSAILNTQLKKEELLKQTKELFILEGLADSAQLATVVYDENLSEYKIRFGFKHGQFKSKGMMGAAFIAPATILYFDAIFSFNNAGQIKITFTNFDSKVLAAIDENDYLNHYKGGSGEATLDADIPLINEMSTILMTETAIGKALLFANGGLDMLNKNHRGEFRKKLTEQFRVYERSCKKGSCIWITKETISNYKMKNNTYWNDQVEKFKSDKLVIAVDNYRWDNYFELNFNYFFKEIASLVSGKIDKIALDGNITYEIFENKLLPVDSKERKQWLKKNIEF